MPFEGDDFELKDDYGLLMAVPCSLCLRHLDYH